MSDGRATAGAAQRVGSGFGRAARAWRVMGSERRLAACAAIGMFLTLFLPWYQETLFADGSKKLQSASVSITGWGAFSFVEAAVLLVAAGVLTLLFQRAEGRAFHLPGGDGWVIMAAGFWACVLIVWRIFDKQGGAVHGQVATTFGIEWGIFVALAVAALLAYSGSRIRVAHQPEPPLPGEHDAPRPRNARGARRAPGAPAARPPRGGRPTRQPRPIPADRPARRRWEPPGDSGHEAATHPSAFPAPPAWSGGDVPTFDTQRLGADPRRSGGADSPTVETHRTDAAEPPTTSVAAAPTTRVRKPRDPHDQPTIPIERDRGNDET